MERTKERQKRVRDDDEEFLLGRRALLGRHLHVRVLRRACYEQRVLRQQERDMMAYLHQQNQQEQTQRLLQSLQYSSLVLEEAERARTALALAQRALFCRNMLSQSSHDVLPAQSCNVHNRTTQNSNETIKSWHFPKDKQTEAPASAAWQHESDSVKRGYTLSLSSDEELLSGYQILVCKALEFFVADTEDTSTNVQGRKKTIQVGQVGIRCRYCAHLPVRSRGRGAVYYPWKLSGVSQAAQNIATTHLNTVCAGIPDQERAELMRQHQLQRRDSKTGGKEYWVSSCCKLGLEERETGLWFQSNNI